MRRPRKWLIAALAIAALPVQAAHAVPLVATNGSNLYRFDSNNLVALSANPVTGMQAGETLVGIDTRPIDGLLYGIGTTSRLYRIDPDTAVATPISSVPFSVPLNGTAFGMDFNPAVDRIREVSNTEQNMRINPLNGTVAANDTLLSPAGNIVATGYTNNFAGATTTTLYDIDSQSGKLMMQGGPDGSPSPNTGALTEVGSLLVGTNLNENIGLEVTPAGQLLATIAPAPTLSRLYTIDPATGAATNLGRIGDGTTAFRGLAVYKPSTARFAVESTVNPRGVEGGSVTLVVNRLGNDENQVDVAFATAQGTAINDVDYQSTGGSFSWSPGDKSARVITVPVKQDRALEGDETFTVTLQNPGGLGAYVAQPASVTVTIPGEGQLGPEKPSDDKPAPVTTQTTTTVTTPAPPPPPTPPASRDTTAPTIGGTGPARQRTRVVLRDGLAFRLTSSELCSLDATLTVETRTARRLRLPGRFGTVKTALRPGAQTLRVKPGRAAAKRLRRMRSVPVNLVGTCVDAAGNRTTVKRSTTLRR